MATAKTKKKEEKPEPTTPKSNPNLEFWDSVAITDPNFTRSVDQRGGFTSIDAHWQIWQATEKWGPYGDKWGLRNIKFMLIDGEKDGVAMPLGVAISAEFFCPISTFEIINDIKYRPNDEAFKKIQTDTTTKALSKLGFSADVFFGLYDDNRYYSQAHQRYVAHKKAQNGATEPPLEPQTAPGGEGTQPDPQGPVTVTSESEPFDGPFADLLALEISITDRLFAEQYPILKAFMPNEKSKKAARQNIRDLVKLKISEDEDLRPNDQEMFEAEDCERMYCSVLNHIADVVAERIG